MASDSKDAPTLLAPATEKWVSRLLPPKRQQQIEVWLDEIVQYASFQSCASDGSHGHVSDSLPSLQQQQNKPIAVCPVCNRHFECQALPSAGKPSISCSNHQPKEQTSLLRRIRSVIGSARPKKDSNDTHDLASATKMYLVHHRAESTDGSDYVDSEVAHGPGTPAFEQWRQWAAAKHRLGSRTVICPDGKPRRF